jgi:hypothetical protein
MSFFSKLNQKLIENRFKRKGLNIIQDIPSEKIKEIISFYVNEGWEIGPQYFNKDALIDSGECAIRRGQSTLLFEWSEGSQGSITGPERIVTSIAHQNTLTAHTSPKARC